MERAVALGGISFQAIRYVYLGEAYLLADQEADARRCVELALDLARSHGERGHHAYALRLLGDLDARPAGMRAESARTHYQQALTLAKELGMRPLQAHCQRGLGVLCARLDRVEAARHALSAAYDLYREMEMASWLPQIEAALGEVAR